MTVDKSRTLQTLEGRSLEPDGEQNVALTMWTTLFVDDRHVGFGGPRYLDFLVLGVSVDTLIWVVREVAGVFARKVVFAE